MIHTKTAHNPPVGPDAQYEKHWFTDPTVLVFIQYFLFF